MKLWTLFFLTLMLSSCQDFDFKKQSAEEIMQEELKSINWEEVDFYPTFQNCGLVTSKEESKVCFETQIKQAVSNRLSQQQILTSKSAQDTVILELFITEEGEALLKTISISDELSAQNPDLDDWLKEAISELPDLYPAQKRSVPVPLRSELPIILK
ncbi:hypothetical protein G3567_07365 [Psychroflexus sp. YR1-1]|uniref:TonB protein C-terminal n=1 Tax=Psychroflexus aurantiacus TaxID=2709310 RepID=A0A6B3R080_9FLAO|nr:hypothetical protein [Psychroflexus aurantiacus]NEV93963.1 hypothetical protein [Psychroflexus aurantiacus]